MSAPMKKHPIKPNNKSIRIFHAGVLYQFPTEIAKKYRVTEKKESDLIHPNDIFSNINKKYTKPGALLKGIRVRENLTQIEMAKKIKVTQSDISQMENGSRNIGRKIAQRIGKIFGVDYRSFLA